MRASREPVDSLGDPAAATGPDSRATVLVLGTSLTAGHGLTRPETDGYPARLQARIDSAGLPFRVVEAGVSGDTSAGGLRRIGGWLRAEDPRVVLIELGANDGLRGLPVSEMEANLRAIADSIRVWRPETAIFLARMEAPPNLGPDYTDAFRTVFRRVATEEGLRTTPFLLEGVAGVPELNQSDGVHPTPEGHRRIVENLWPTLGPALDSIAGTFDSTSEAGGSRPGHDAAGPRTPSPEPPQP